MGSIGVPYVVRYTAVLNRLQIRKSSEEANEKTNALTDEKTYEKFRYMKEGKLNTYSRAVMMATFKEFGLLLPYAK